MIYILFWLCSFLVITTTIASIYRVATKSKTSSNLVGGIIGVVLRGLTFGWLFVLVYPLLAFYK